MVNKEKEKMITGVVVRGIIMLVTASLFFAACEGPTGPQGLPGGPGAKGDTGDKGDKGDRGDPPVFIIERVSFTGLTANGDGGTTTTALTLSFSNDLTGLSPEDITFIDTGNTGAVKGGLNRTGTGTYQLGVFGVTSAGSINVVISKQGYVANPVYRSVSLYFNAASVLTFTDLDAMKSYLEGAPANGSSSPYQIVLNSVNLETDLDAYGDPLNKLYVALGGRYVSLDLRGCTGQTLRGFSSYTGSRPNTESLVSVILPDTITAIGDYTFHGCHALQSIILPATLQSIGDYAFGGCIALQSITLPATLQSIGDYAFYDCEVLRSITLPAALQSIGDYVFNNCGLLSVTLPATLQSIGDYAFSGCDVLQSITLPAALQSIGDYAFSYCGLLSITLPATLQSIGDSAFSECSALQSVTCMAVTPPGMGPPSMDGNYWVFYDTYYSLAITVPMASVAVYRAAPGWSQYADRIVGQ